MSATNEQLMDAICDLQTEMTGMKKELRGEMGGMKSELREPKRMTVLMTWNKIKQSCIGIWATSQKMSQPQPSKERSTVTKAISSLFLTEWIVAPPG